MRNSVKLYYLKSNKRQHSGCQGHVWFQPLYKSVNNTTMEQGRTMFGGALADTNTATMLFIFQIQLLVSMNLILLNCQN